MSKNLQRVAVITGVRRELRKAVPLSTSTGSGFTTEHNGYEFGDVEILIDPRALVNALGPKAMASKSGTSKLQGGAIVLKVIRRRREGAAQ